MTPEAIVAVLVGVGGFPWILWSLWKLDKEITARSAAIDECYKKLFACLAREAREQKRLRDLFRNLKSDGSVWSEENRDGAA